MSDLFDFDPFESEKPAIVPGATMVQSGNEKSELYTDTPPRNEYPDVPNEVKKKWGNSPQEAEVAVEKAQGVWKSSVPKFENLEDTTKSYGSFPTRPSAKKKYNIMDLFWLLNPKYGTDKPAHKDEAEFVTIAFNMDFGNLKINFSKIPDGAIVKNVVFNQSLRSMVSGTMYPAACFRTAPLCSKRDNFTAMEQLINDTGEKWQKERPICSIYHINYDDSPADLVVNNVSYEALKSAGWTDTQIVNSEYKNTIPEKICGKKFTRLIIYDHKGNINYYDFKGWQEDVFNHAVSFVINQGFSIVAKNKLEYNNV